MRGRLIGSGCAVLAVTGMLAFINWGTAIDLGARQRAYDRIVPGMRISEVERLMRWPGREERFHKAVGNIEFMLNEWRVKGVPRVYEWEDAYTTVAVTFQAPEPMPPVVVCVDRRSKSSPDLAGVRRWRGLLAVLLVLGLGLLVRGLLEPKPAAVSNSPGGPGNGPLP